MIGRLFAPLASKLFGGLAAALMIALVFTWSGKQAAERRASALQDKLAAASAFLAAQNAGIEALEARSGQARRAAERALAAARRETVTAETAARSMEMVRPLSGRCETPREIREADL